MRINTSGLHSTRTSTDLTADLRSHPAAPTVTRSGPDTVTVSARARLLALARDALAEVPAVRPGVIEAARARLARSEGWDDAQVAEAIVRAIAQERQ
ncbi:MAG: hypothetical protein AB7Y46_17945 [Armatimonadota bacterium]